jgi:hypothetical protein
MPEWPAVAGSIFTSCCTGGLSHLLKKASKVMNNTVAIFMTKLFYNSSMRHASIAVRATMLCQYLD